MANSKSAPKQSTEIPYLKPVKYEDLVRANRHEAIDPQSQKILALEEAYIRSWRVSSGGNRSPDSIATTLAGLALSGGGIRSATFALGVTQALAADDLMRKFDYLSTVSGGGYLGASLTWLTRKCNADSGGGFVFGMDRDHFPYPVDPPETQTGRRTKPPQDARLIYLRQHGKYLTPGHGIDIVSAIAVVLRGFLLNLLVWLPILALALLVLMTVPPIDDYFPSLAFMDPYGNGYGWMAVIASVSALVFAVFAVLYSLATRLPSFGLAWRYHGRRAFESQIRYALWTIAITVPIALMPFVEAEARTWISSAGFASILAGLASAAGTFLRSRSGNGEGGLAMSVVAPIGAILTLYGMLVLAYVGADMFYECVNKVDGFPWVQPSLCEDEWVSWTGLFLLGLAFITGIFVNVNLISLHRYYRDRLMEAFLPDPPVATPPSSPSPTDTKLEYSELATKADVKALHRFGGLDERKPTGPYHLLNTNVILVNSPERNWRLRGGDSFVLSPLLCGSNATGWCDTRKFLGGDLTLATAMAISGAAANPYAGGGLFRNRPVALLMALANIRLGYWVSHPDSKKYVKYLSGRTHFSTAWRELSGKLDENRPMLQLSDGGHFDNLGIYELIRRRAKLIVVCDGTADPLFGFSDFITLLARVEADFGARIIFDKGSGLEVFMPSTAAGYPRNTQLAKRGYTVGKIRYSDTSVEGHLVYVTTTLFEGLGVSALGYKAANPDFPDQTTADQFFDEAQFEAYRHLGYSVGEAMLRDEECGAIVRRGLA